MLIYGPDPHGGMVVKAAQCKGPCGELALPDPVRQAPPEGVASGAPEVLTARKPGWCCECPRAIFPGDMIVYMGGRGFAHYECAPAPAPPPYASPPARPGRPGRR